MTTTHQQLGSISFNPRARDGREAGKFCAELLARVSIHAPVMDANWWINQQYNLSLRFNPRARDGRETNR